MTPLTIVRLESVEEILAEVIAELDASTSPVAILAQGALLVARSAVRMVRDQLLGLSGVPEPVEEDTTERQRVSIRRALD